MPCREFLPVITQTQLRKYNCLIFIGPPYLLPRVCSIATNCLGMSAIKKTIYLVLGVVATKFRSAFSVDERKDGHVYSPDISLWN